jgi:hypothetical protein
MRQWQGAGGGPRQFATLQVQSETSAQQIVELPDNGKRPGFLHLS